MGARTQENLSPLRAPAGYYPDYHQADRPAVHSVAAPGPVSALQQETHLLRDKPPSRSGGYYDPLAETRERRVSDAASVSSLGPQASAGSWASTQQQVSTPRSHVFVVRLVTFASWWWVMGWAVCGG
jgi:hypothetical protein